jgi:excisionase family DNA binding protein
MSTLTVTEREGRQARELVERAPHPQLNAASDGETFAIPDALRDLLVNVIQTVAAGGSVTLQTLPATLTTTVAADQLGVSRPTLMRMIRDGEIEAHKVGTHHRLKLADVQDFRRARLERQRAAFEELRQLEDELGLE